MLWLGIVFIEDLGQLQNDVCVCARAHARVCVHASLFMCLQQCFGVMYQSRVFNVMNLNVSYNCKMKMFIIENAKLPINFSFSHQCLYVCMHVSQSGGVCFFFSSKVIFVNVEKLSRSQLRSLSSSNRASRGTEVKVLVGPETLTWPNSSSAGFISVVSPLPRNVDMAKQFICRLHFGGQPTAQKR